MTEPHTGQHLASTEASRAFEVFYLTNTTSLVAFLIVQGASLADAADMAQDTMSEAYRRWHTIDHPRPWIY
jgi:DNA-directed RNA polymerase specialized sigma24 family protein